MERRIIDLSCSVFSPVVSDWFINFRGKSAGDGVTGAGQVIIGNQPRWEATLNIAGFKQHRVLSWRAFRAKMRGRINVVRVCVCDHWRPTLAQLGIPLEDILAMRGQGIPYAQELVEGTEESGDLNPYHSDGTGHAYAPNLVATDEYLAGAESLEINAAAINDTLLPGHFFSHDDWLYQITGVSGPVSARVYEFEPPLRRAIPEGAEISVGEATCLMAFIDDTQGRMPLQYGRSGDAQIQLVEWVNRP